jgi:hypothetical protein
MVAWQLLQGNIPSVIGGGATGNSSDAQYAEGIRQNPNKYIPNVIALVFSLMFVMNNRRDETSIELINILNDKKQLFLKPSLILL